MYVRLFAHSIELTKGSRNLRGTVLFASKKQVQICAGTLKVGSISLTCLLHCRYFNGRCVNERTRESTSRGATMNYSK